MSTTTLNPRRAQSRSLIRRHPLISFFVLTYVIAWLLWAPLVIFGDQLPGPLGFVLQMLGTLVPSTLGILFVALLRGRSGVRQLLGRLLHARVGLRWYLVVLLAPFVLSLSVLFAGARVVDTTIFFVLFLFAFHIFPGSALGEELGWRGFALPRMQARHSALKASLILGIVWGSFHLPLWLRGAESNPISYFPAFVIAVIATSVLCTWLYNSTGGSLLIVVLYHAAINLPLTVLITPLGSQMVQPFLIYVGITVIAALVVVIATGGENLSRTAHRQIEQP